MGSFFFLTLWILIFCVGSTEFVGLKAIMVGEGGLKEQQEKERDIRDGAMMYITYYYYTIIILGESIVASASTRIPFKGTTRATIAAYNRTVGPKIKAHCNGLELRFENLTKLFANTTLHSIEFQVNVLDEAPA